jgi:hypothetical protein
MLRALSIIATSPFAFYGPRGVEFGSKTEPWLDRGSQGWRETSSLDSYCPHPSNHSPVGDDFIYVPPYWSIDQCATLMYVDRKTILPGFIRFAQWSIIFQCLSVSLCVIEWAQLCTRASVAVLRHSAIGCFYVCSDCESLQRIKARDPDCRI